MNYPRLVTVDDGVAMVVTDLHGAWDVYERLRDRFLSAHANGQLDRLILCGDLIHSPYGYGNDASLEMLHDVMRLQATLGSNVVIMLSGNHEMPHIYTVPFSKGDVEFLQPFEYQLNQAEADPTIAIKRAEVLAFLRGLPFYVQTRAGVTISHAGAPTFINSLDALEIVLTFDHDVLLQAGDHLLATRYDRKKLAKNAYYRAEVKRYLGIEDPKDPRFSLLFRGEVISQTQQLYQVLWNTLFLSNERGRSLKTYLQEVEQFLMQLSSVSPHVQQVLVAGHVPVSGGYQVLGPQKFRMASYSHATPVHAGVCLILDCGKSVQTAEQLVPYCVPSKA